MNLAIIGYGKMGRMLHQLAPEYGLNVALTQDDSNFTPEQLQGVDVAVEFSVPEATVDNIERLARAGVNVVVGTTGWSHEMARVRKVVDESGIGLVWSPNYSIGVTLFARLVAEAARMFAAHPEYGAWGWEIHHSAKKDAPSGTLIKLIDGMKQAGFDRPIDRSSSRAGAHPGTHEIGFDSLADTVTLRHTSRGREGFARGALTAAKWVCGRKGFFSIEDVLFGSGTEA